MKWPLKDWRGKDFGATITGTNLLVCKLARVTCAVRLLHGAMKWRVSRHRN